MNLSILLCRLRERPGPVIDRLIAQAEPHPDVEILWLGDNRRRSIGLKRQALLDAARGERIAFVDDDDEVRHDYVKQILAISIFSQAPVITFDALVRYDNGGSDCYVECQAGNPNEEVLSGERIKRAAWHTHAWRADVARQVRFEDSSYGEDWAWASAIQPQEPCPRIPFPLYFYRERR